MKLWRDLNDPPLAAVDVWREYGVSRKTLIEWEREGLAIARIGSKVFVRKSELFKFIDLHVGISYCVPEPLEYHLRCVWLHLLLVVLAPAEGIFWQISVSRWDLRTHLGRVQSYFSPRYDK